MCYQLNEHPLVSVIIPAYNAQEFIGATLQSLICQSYPHLEVIVCDDGSNDQTVQVVKKWMKKDQRIKLIEQINRGTAYARNSSICQSAGSFIAPVDADDICHPEKIAKQVACLQHAANHVGLVYSWSTIIDHNGKIKGYGSMPEYEGAVFEDLLFSNFIGNGSCCLIRKTCFDAAGLYNTDHFLFQTQGCEDYDMYLRIAELFDFSVVKEFLTAYRITINGQSKNYKAMEKSRELVFRYQKIKNPWIPDSIYMLSSSYFYLWLSQIAIDKKCCYNSVRYLIKAVTNNPAFIKNKYFITILLIRIAKGIIDKMRFPVATANKGNQHFKIKNNRPTCKQFSFEDLKPNHHFSLKKSSLQQLKERQRMIVKQILKHAINKKHSLSETSL